jgi:hypothetical protein
MIDPKAVEAARRMLTHPHPGAWSLDKIDEAVLANDDIGISLTEAILAATKLARSSLTQARDEIVEGIKSTFLASTIEGPCVWVSFETTQCAERFIASLKTGERDAG